MWFKISREEWDLLSQLFPVLICILDDNIRNPYSHLIYLRSSSVPHSFVDDLTLHPCVCVAAAQGHTMLNKYYGLSDDLIMY